VVRVPTEINKYQQSAAKGYVISPRLVARADAAHYVGVGTTLFDELVRQGMMPRPKAIGTRRLWDLRELDKAIDELPEAGTSVQDEKSHSEWDAVA
jgi:hypothetical protein